MSVVVNEVSDKITIVQKESFDKRINSLISLVLFGMSSLITWQFEILNTLVYYDLLLSYTWLVAL